MAASSTEPKRPVRAGWERVETESGAGAESWVHEQTGIVASSSVDTMPFGAPRYRLAVSAAAGGRCSASLALMALADFDLLDAVEDAGAGRAGRVFLLPP